MSIFDKYEDRLVRENIKLAAQLAYKTAVNDTIKIVAQSFKEEDQAGFIDRETEAAELRYMEKVNESGIW